MKTSARQAIALLALCAALMWIASNTAWAQGQSGTTLTASKTAQGYFNRTEVYDWTVAKTVDKAALTIKQGESDTVEFTIKATRTGPVIDDVFGVSGQVCVTNGGAQATQSLTVFDHVQFKNGLGPFQELGANQTLAGFLAAGASDCSPYNIEFVPVSGAIYRNAAKVTITNHSGQLGTPFGPEPKADFSLPTTPTVVQIDDGATVTDTISCPAGFTCTPGSGGVHPFSDSGSTMFVVQIENNSAQCDTHFRLTNMVELDENDTHQKDTDDLFVDIYTGLCEEPPDEEPGDGCTLTIGYWKNHAGFSGKNRDRVTPLLPIQLGAGGGATVAVTTASQAVQILRMRWNGGRPSNGVSKLYAQLLAAKLSIANGADGSAAAAAIGAADLILAVYDHAAWKSLSRTDRRTILNLAMLLDAYNNGSIGPGDCNG